MRRQSCIGSIKPMQAASAAELFWINYVSLSCESTIMPATAET